MSPSPSAEDFRPIFIAGCPRGGTTLMGRLLDRHSRVAIANEFFFFSNIAPKCGGKSRDQMLDLWFSDEDCKHQGLDRDALKSRLEGLPEEARSLLKAALTEYSHLRGKERGGEKTPRNVYFLDQIFDWFPNAQVILTVRDGRDTSLSTSKLPWTHSNLMESSQRFRDSVRAIQAGLAKHPERLRLVRYEDLLSDPEKVMRGLDAWLGLDFEPTQFEGDQKGAFAKSDESWMLKASQGLDASRIYAWRKSLPKKDLWRINAMIGPELKAMGYEDWGLEGCPLWRKVLIWGEVFLVNALTHPWVKPWLKWAKHFVQRLGLWPKAFKKLGF